MYYHYLVFADDRCIANGSGNKNRIRLVQRIVIGEIPSAKHEKAGIIFMERALGAKLSVRVVEVGDEASGRLAEKIHDEIYPGCREDNREKMEALLAKRGEQIGGIHPELRMLLRTFVRCGDSFLHGLIANRDEPLVKEFFKV